MEAVRVNGFPSAPDRLACGGPDSIELLTGCRGSLTGAASNRVGVAAGNRSEGVSACPAPAALPLR